MKNHLKKIFVENFDWYKTIAYFDKTDGFIWLYNRTKYLVLFGPEKYNAIYSRMRYVKVILLMFFLIIMQELKLIHMTLFL